MKAVLILALTLFGGAWAVHAQSKPKKPVVINKSTVDKGKKIVKGYNLGSLRYDEIKATLDEIKTKKGSISYIKANHRILVVDVQSVHDLVQQIVSQVSGPIVNITIDVEFKNLQAFRDKGIKLAWDNYDGKTGRAKFKYNPKTNPKLQRPQGVSIDLKDQKTINSKYTKQSVTVTSGKPSQLWITSEALDKAELKYYELAPFGVIRNDDRVVVIDRENPEIIKREVGSSLWVLPTYMQNGLVHVEVFPVVTYETTNKGEQSFRVEKVKTTVVVKPGQKIFIGGGDKNMRKYMKDVFGTDFSRSGKTDNLGIYLTPHVQILDPKNRKKGSSAPVRQGRKDMWRHFPN